MHAPALLCPPNSNGPPSQEACHRHAGHGVSEEYSRMRMTEAGPRCRRAGQETRLGLRGMTAARSPPPGRQLQQAEAPHLWRRSATLGRLGGLALPAWELRSGPGTAGRREQSRAPFSPTYSCPARRRLPAPLASFALAEATASHTPGAAAVLGASLGRPSAVRRPEQSWRCGVHSSPPGRPVHGAGNGAQILVPDSGPHFWDREGCTHCVCHLFGAQKWAQIPGPKNGPQNGPKKGSRGQATARGAGHWAASPPEDHVCRRCAARARGRAMLPKVLGWWRRRRRKGTWLHPRAARPVCGQGPQSIREPNARCIRGARFSVLRVGRCLLAPLEHAWLGERARTHAPCGTPRRETPRQANGRERGPRAVRGWVSMGEWDGGTRSHVPG